MPRFVPNPRSVQSVFLCLALIGASVLYAQTPTYRPELPRATDHAEAMRAQRRLATRLRDRLNASQKRNLSQDETEAIASDRAELDDWLALQIHQTRELLDLVTQDETQARLQHELARLTDLRHLLDDRAKTAADLPDRMTALLAEPEPSDLAPWAPLWASPEAGAVPLRRGPPPSTVDTVDLLAEASGNAGPEHQAKTSQTPLLDRLPAEARQSPLALLRYLEIHLAHDPYFGNQRAPRTVLDDRAANDLDAALLLAALLTEMDVEARVIHGQVLLPAEPALAWLSVAEPGAVAEVLRAAAVPFEPILAEGRIEAFRLERFWVEAWLPLSGYRGTGAGAGDRAWLPLDPLSRGTVPPDSTDAFAAFDLDTTDLLDTFETVAGADLPLDDQAPTDSGATPFLAWLDQQLATHDANLADLTTGYTAPAAGPNLLSLSLPFTVEQQLAAFTPSTLPRALQHRARFLVRDAAGTPVLEHEIALAELGGRILSWDAVPATPSDFELVALHGSRWQVPSHLLRLKPALLLEGNPIATADLDFAPGQRLELDLAIQTPTETFATVTNALTWGGFAVLAVSGGGHPLVPAATDLPVYDPARPFGNSLHAVATAYLRRVADTRWTLAKAMRLRLVQPTAGFAWARVHHRLTTLDGLPAALEPVALALDADFLPARPVAPSAAFPAERLAEFRRLDGLAAAQQERRILESLHPDLRAVSVPGVLGYAAAQGLGVEDLVPGDQTRLVAFPLPASFHRRLEAALDQGLQVRLTTAPLALGEATVFAARLHQPSDGRTAWLLDDGLSGAVTANTASSLFNILGAAFAFPEVDRRVFGDREVAFLMTVPGWDFDVVPADSGKAEFHFLALNSLGRPVPDASIELQLRNQRDQVPVGYHSHAAVTNGLGIAEFRFQVPPYTDRNAHFAQLEEAHQHLSMVSAYHYVARSAQDPTVVANNDATALVKPGAARTTAVRLDTTFESESFNFIVTVGHVASLFPFLLDAHGNPITNRTIELALQGTNTSESCDGFEDIATDFVSEAGSLPYRPDAALFEERDLRQPQRRLSFTARLFGDGLYLEPGQFGDVVSFGGGIVDRAEALDISGGGAPPLTVLLVSAPYDPATSLGEIDYPGNADYEGPVYGTSCIHPAQTGIAPRGTGWEASDICGVSYSAGSNLLGLNDPAAEAAHRNPCYQLRFGDFGWNGVSSADRNGMPRQLFRIDPDSPGGHPFDIPVEVTKIVKVAVHDPGNEGEREAFACSASLACKDFFFDLGDQHVPVQELRPGFLRLRDGSHDAGLPYELTTFDGFGRFQLSFTVDQPGIVHGRFYYHVDSQSLEDGSITKLADSMDTDFLIGFYSCTFDEPVRVALDGRNRQIADVAVAPTFAPADLPYLRLHRYEILKDGAVVSDSFRTGSTRMQLLAGSVWDPDARYQIRFSYDVDRAGQLAPEGFTATVDVILDRGADLAVIDIEEHSLWLDTNPPATGKRRADRKRPDDACADPDGDGLFRAWPVFAQRYTYSHLQDYRDVDLSLTDEATGFTTMFIDDLPTTGTDEGELAEARLPHEAARPFLFEREPPTTGGFMAWQMTGDPLDSQAGPVFGPKRLLPYKFLIGGVGVIVPGETEDERARGYETDYELVLEEDPVGDADTSCNAINRKLGFQLNHEATRVRFSLGDRVLYDGVPLPPGQYESSHDFLTPGLFEWTFEADFRDGARNTYTLTRSGTIDIVKRVRKRMAIGSTVVRGVNLNSGSLNVGSTDLHIPGLNGGLAFTRSYSSGGGQNYNPLGIGWIHNYQSRLVEGGCDILQVVGGDGSGQDFQRHSDGQYRPAMPGVHSRLEANAYGGYTLITKSGRAYVYGPPLPFDPGGEAPFTFGQNLRFIEDSFGNRTVIRYDDLTRQIREVQEPAGRKLVFSYDYSGFYPLLTSITTEGVVPAITVHFAHDADGRLVQVTRDERVERYQYTRACEGHRLTQFTNPNGFETAYVYYAPGELPDLAVDAGWIKEIREPEGLTTRFVYWDQGNGITGADVSDDLSTTSYQFNLNGQPIQITGPLGTKRMTWTEGDVLLLSETDEAGRSFSYGYDANGNTTLKRQDGVMEETWTYHPLWNKPLTYTDPRGNTTTWDLDEAMGAVLAVNDAMGNRTEFGYDARGLLETVTDPRGHETSYTYDDLGYAQTQTLADGNVVRTTYDSRGRLRSSRDSADRNTSYRYDHLDRLLSETSTADQSGGRLMQYFDHLPMGQPQRARDGVLEIEYGYDELNRAVTLTLDPGEGQPRMQRDLTYDIHGNPIQEVWSGDLGMTKTFVRDFDPADRLERETLNGQFYSARTYREGTELVASITDWRGAVTQASYDPKLHLDALTLATGHQLDFDYDVAGNRIREVDGNGHVTSYSYDPLNRVAFKVDPLGHRTEYDYDASGNLLGWRNRTTGAGETQQFDELNRVVRHTSLNPAGSGDQVRSYAYLQHGRRVIETLPEDLPITVEMNQLGQTTAMSQGDIVERYHYNANHGVVRVEHPERFETLRQVDGMGRVVEERAPHDYLTRHRYDIYGNLVEATDPRGIQTQISYDRFDRPLTRQSSHATGTITAHWSYSQSTGRTTVVGTDHRGNTVTGLFDELGRLLEQTDTARGATRHQSWDAANLRFARDYNGNETHFHYDGLNRLIWQRDAGGEIRTAYDDEHLTVQTVDRRGITTVAGFDQLGNLLTRSRAGIRLETNQYDRQNRVLVQTDAEGIAHRTSYDAHGRLARQAVGDQVTQFRQYNQLGYPGEVHDGRVSLFQTHDFYGRVVSTTNELDEQVRMAYDPAGNLTLRDAPSPTGERARTQYAYDLLNNLRQVIEPNGAETRYDWNPTWTEQTVTDAEQVVSAWTYDLAGRLTAIQHPGLGVTGFGYDANDNRTSVERPIGSATFGYDYRNRVMDETWEGNAHADAAIHSIDRERDANGNLTRVRQIGSEGTYERHIDYDDLDRPYQFSDSRGLGHTIGYYDNGTRESVTDARGFTVRYTYDPANRLETAVVDGQGVARFGYHANGLPEEISLPNGTRTAYAFDRANRPTELGHERPDGSATRYHATYHADGSRASLVEDRGDLGRWETTYRYDINSRLTEWTRTTPQHRRTTSLSLDRVGNRTYELEEGDGYARERAYSYQPGHQISGFTETTREDEVLTASRQVLYDYDANGNRTAKTDVDRLAKRATATRMRWDARDRLRRVEHDGIEALNFAYDDLDRRIRKWGDSRQGSAMLYTWDELAVLSEHEEGAGAGGDPLPLASYAFAGQRLAIERVGVGVQWFHHDPLGSVAELTDAAGALVEAKTFDPWGREEQVFASAAGGYNRYGFTGHEYDPETELTYAKARYYDQDLGVFASMDRWDFAQFDRPPSLHRYQYASRNPLAFIDPTGNNDVSLDGFMDLVHDANANIQIAQTSVQKSVMGLLKGALSVVVEGAEETVKMALDLGMTNVSMTHYALTGEFIDFQMQSAIGKGSEQGMTHGDLFNGVVTGVANLPVEYGKAIASGDPERIGKATTNLISVMWGFRTLNPATLKAGVTQGVSRVTRGVKASAKIVKEGVEKTATVAKRVKQGAKVTLAKAKGAATTAGRVARIYGRQFGRELMKPRLGSLGGNFQSAIDAGVRVASRIKSGKILSRRKISRNNYQIKKRGIHGRRILNIGAGDNPMPRAINADIRDVPGVDVVADANKLPFSTNHFDKVFAHNPFGFNPVTGDVARVLKPGGTMTVTGQPRNPFFRQFVDKLSKEELRKMGFEKISHGSIVDDLILGTPKTTTGKPLDTSVMIQVTLRKL